MLEVNHVTKKYKKEKACDDVTFFLPEGGIHVLLGPNGAGKSTIMKSIIGFLKYSGEIKINGYNNKSLEAKKIIGYMPEIPSLYANLTVDEHMEFVAKAYRLKDYTDYKNELLERFELADKKKKFGDELSKGMQQKLSLCCALLPKPALLLMDEPMIGLDPHAIKELKKMMHEMKENGQSLFISTHIIDSMDQLWDHAIIMQKGQVKGNVTHEQLQEMNKTLEEVFFEITEGLSGEDMSESAPEEENKEK
ncbi:MAG: ABC transporter ATP-binding protein [Lachnospiraceae bacterium]|nr:ABC transporter ATP-binding protein [Lachnospiraceae bacterium]